MDVYKNETKSAQFKMWTLNWLTDDELIALEYDNLEELCQAISELTAQGFPISDAIVHPPKCNMAISEVLKLNKNLV